MLQAWQVFVDVSQVRMALSAEEHLLFVRVCVLVSVTRTGAGKTHDAVVAGQES